MGISISIDYPYNKTAKTDSNLIACLLGSAVYACISSGLIYFIYSKRRRPQHSSYIRIPSSVEEIQLHDFSNK